MSRCTSELTDDNGTLDVRVDEGVELLDRVNVDIGNDMLL